MEKIAAFKTSDGQVFYDRKAAKTHEANIVKLNNLRALAHATAPENVNPEFLASYLVNNALFIEKILKGENVVFESKVTEVPAPVESELDSDLQQLLEESDQTA